MGEFGDWFIVVVEYLNLPFSKFKGALQGFDGSGSLVVQRRLTVHSTSNEQLAVAEPQARYNRQHSKLPASVSIKGAREHNLKDISCQIDHNKMTVVTGVSGSGKSSLAFDIIFAEGQRRFMESMSAYARQFVEQMPRADVDELQGIAPTVAIEQRVTKGTRKSTVATITEVPIPTSALRTYRHPTLPNHWRSRRQPIRSCPTKTSQKSLSRT